VLDDARMTRLLLALKADEGLNDRTIAQAFSFAAVVAATEGEWGLTQDEAARAVHEWIDHRGEVNAVAKPPLLMVHSDAWNELVRAHGSTVGE
jgi:hypothetical protein